MARGAFQAPESYKEEALVTSTTHDLVPLPGYWQGIDLKKRLEAGVYRSDEEYNGHCRERQSDLRNLLRAFMDAGVLDPEESNLEVIAENYQSEVLFSSIKFLAQTPSKIVSIPLEDLLEAQEPFNVPGVIDAFPPWRTKLPSDSSDLKSDYRINFLWDLIGRT